MSFNCNIDNPSAVKYSLFNSFFSPSISSTSSNPVIDVSAIFEWLRKYNSVFTQFEKVTSNGFYSILEKEIEMITPLVIEGQRIKSLSPNYPAIAGMVNDLVLPRLTQLQTVYVTAQKKLIDNLKEKERDTKLALEWEKLGLPASVLENYADCARFLFTSRLVFAIVGFRETSNNPNEHDLKLDPTDGHPMLKMQGRWTRWETINREVYFDETTEKIKSRHCLNHVIKSWSYFHPGGLVPVDRFDYGQILPIYELSQEEYHQTLQTALKFYETNPEKDPGFTKDCIVQFTTIDHRVVPKGAIFDNAQRNYPVHIGIRLITADRKVYSFGFQRPPEEAIPLFKDYFSNFLATANAKVGMLDFDEFRPFNKCVTSIPLTGLRALSILKFVNELKGKQLRFQYMRQNCSQFAHEVLQKAGYDIDLRTSAVEILWSSIPSLSQLPIIGMIGSIVERVWELLPSFAKRTFEWTAYVISYVPIKMAKVLTNFLAWKMGAAKKTTPLYPGVEDEEFYDRKKLHSFSAVIRSWTDLFRDEINAAYHSKYFIDWQKKQRSTFNTIYSGRPKLCIFPLKA